MFLLSFRPALALRGSCRKVTIACHLSQQAARDRKVYVPLAEADGASFEAAGIRPLLAASLRSAFPNVQAPTAMQRKLLRAISQNRDVLLQDDTGTGKSFAAMLALLSKLPARKTSTVHRGENSAMQALTALLLVPHRDLAYQYLYWVHQMTLLEGDTPSSLTAYAQVLVRHANKETLQGLPVRMQEAIRSASSDQDLLVQKPPHILIATPNAVLELMEREPEALWLAAPSTVVVDEVDALLRVPGSNVPKERQRGSQREVEKHVPDLVRLLDRLYPTRREKAQSLEQAHGHRPQLIMMSATLRSKLQSALFNTFRWVRRKEVLKLSRKRSSTVPAHRLGRSAVHHVLVVSKTGDIRNIDGARPSPPDTGLLEEEIADEEGISYDGEDDVELVDEADKELVQAPLALDPAMLEAVAAIMALDVRRVGLLVLPASAAVRKIIFELRQLGVNAHPLNLVENEASRGHVLADMGSDSEDPVLIVGTHATIRGIDLPELTHVFMLGVPEGRSGDAYLHVAGRVGRFGRQGKVVSVVEEAKETRVGGRVVVTDEAKKMRILLSRLGIEARREKHFE